MDGQTDECATNPHATSFFLLLLRYQQPGVFAYVHDDLPLSFLIALKLTITKGYMSIPFVVGLFVYVYHLAWPGYITLQNFGSTLEDAL